MHRLRVLFSCTNKKNYPIVSTSHLTFRNFSNSNGCKDVGTPAEGRVVVCSKNGVRRITLNDLRKRNALSLALLDELKSELLHSSQDPETRVVIIGHNGPVFSAGHDLKELKADQGSASHNVIFQRCSEVMNLVQDISVPVIAEVNGVATAAGCQLVATCDLAVASEKSVFATPGVFIGLFCSTPGVAVARAVNRKQALKMLFTGDSITAEEALRCGLINQAVPEDDLRTASEELAGRIVRHSRSVIALGKDNFYKQIKEDRDEAYCMMSNVMVENLKMGDTQEGIDAFFAKRKPKWTS